MPQALREYFIKMGWMKSEATDAEAQEIQSAKIKSGELTAEKCVELMGGVGGTAVSQKTDAIADQIAKKVSEGVVAGLTPVFGTMATTIGEGIAKAMAPAGRTPAPAPAPAADDPEEKPLTRKEMNELLAKRYAQVPADPVAEGQRLLKMGFEAEGEGADPANIRVKHKVEIYSDVKTALTYKSPTAKAGGLAGKPMEYNGKEVNQSTDRTKFMSAVWLKLQLFPEVLTEEEEGVVRYILHTQKFHVPNAKGDTTARLLTAEERAQCYHFNKQMYANPLFQKAVIDDSTSGGENAIPEFFDYDMITTPTLASENIPAYVNMVPVSRGVAAQNFRMGRPTIAANIESNAITPFTTTGFITAHDTDFFRAAGAIEIGRHFAEDANPRLVGEIQNQYMQSVRLWYNEQICAGDGTTEPQGIMNASGTNNVTPTTPSTGPVVLADILEMLFAVPKAYRERFGRGNCIFIMRDLMYSRIRAIATGVTGDTRLVFGMDVESYSLFGHPVLIEENGLSNDHMIFAQMKGYRMYNRQGVRFFREDRGKTLVLANTFIVGCDLRAGGRLDLGGYAAVATGFQT